MTRVVSSEDLYLCYLNYLKQPEVASALEAQRQPHLDRLKELSSKNFQQLPIQEILASVAECLKINGYLIQIQRDTIQTWAQKQKLQGYNPTLVDRVVERALADFTKNAN